ncbi:MAG: DUF1501 domain-containing protein [Paludisphaera borealis]|uniref:DUF1501 domain-containing protein n=1 Tax=Paludisphaera borealis TaxID=1387353 RepID=UPI00283EBF03|nr:DUF1501 domain-containing protein [Paludisphaera borealis]MDR3619117.1 DUF1501 domain-containing protein [Paludisphaera borealis]
MRDGSGHAHGIVRREFLQVGFSGFLGLSLSQILSARALADRAAKAGGGGGSGSKPRAKSMILVFLTGGLSHLDSLDMKPDAPERIRGEFKPIDTAVSGVQFCEHLPMLAARAADLAVVRSMSHKFTNHLNATHELLTGHSQPGAFFDKVASRDDYPCYASGLDYLRPRQDGIPTGVMLPTFLMEGPLVWPGQHAGLLGPRHDPWQIRQDPNKAGFRVDSLALPVGFSVERLGRRQTLLDQINHHQNEALTQSSTGGDSMSDQRARAMSLLLSGKVSGAFDLDKEDPKTRDRYGRHTFGQSLLLARRLVEAGVPIVQVNMGHVQQWDTHSQNFKNLKEHLLPPTDRGVSALLDDLKSRGLLDETLVVMTGEFGRTPRIGSSTGNNNTPDGRDHWAAVFSALFAGAGVQGGQVVGASDRIGAHPASPPYAPADLAATIYQSFGVDPASEIRDRFGRPIRLCDGQPIAPLYSA